jgi:hypothetical protein
MGGAGRRTQTRVPAFDCQPITSRDLPRLIKLIDRALTDSHTEKEDCTWAALRDEITNGRDKETVMVTVRRQRVSA